ncbi:hypothetical protein [Streptomyces sp. 6N223]|uniref:hypothetical protein n=1 Tax=Streptomyces sp. 6N223 TaxID=3457412 RepID=UPI003FD16696
MALSPARLFVVALAILALTLGGRAVAAETPHTAAPCDHCVQDGRQHCTVPKNEAVRDTSPHKEHRHAPGCGQPHAPAWWAAQPADTSRLTGEPPGAPDLHELQRLRV